MKANLERKIILGFSCALALLLIIGFVAVKSTIRLTEDLVWVKNTQEVFARLEGLLSTMTDAETGERGFTITGDEIFLEPYERAVLRANGGFRQLQSLTADNSAQQQQLVVLEPLLAERLAQSKKIVALRRSLGFAAAQAETATGKGRQIHDRIRQLIAEMTAEENRLLLVRERTARVDTRFTITVIVLGGVLAFTVAMVSLLLIRRDLARRRQAEMVLQQTNESLRIATDKALAADRLKSAFLATMSHELRTPLNSIIGFTGIVLQELAGPLNEEQAKQLGMVRGSARHLLALINDILDLSKIEAGELKVSCAPFDLPTSIENVVGIVKPLAEKKGLALRVVGATEPAGVLGDARRVEQVLLNLLTNAIKFTERGEVALTMEETAESVSLRVADTGMGIKPEDLATLFQPFRQIDTGLSRQHEGTGLGLAICRRLAGLLGGGIHAESEPGKGSTFTFILPRKGQTTP